MNILDIGTKYGDVTVTEDDLPYITAADLRRLGISRRDLLRCFAEGVELMKDVALSERVRPVADNFARGGPPEWGVFLCRYSPLTDPLMQAEEGTAH
jgi:hypothetical protein